MVHPAVPCFLFTPICPHSLSSRPLVLPEHVTLRIKVRFSCLLACRCTSEVASGALQHGLLVDYYVDYYVDYPAPKTELYHHPTRFGACLRSA